MRAVVLEETGGPEALSVKDVPDPEAGDGQSLVEVRAVGINFLEVLVRQGRYPQAPPLPWIPGIEIAGETGGRRVLGLARDTGGGYAERAVVDDDWLFDLPEETTFAEGAAFLMAFLTAWIPLTRQADARPGTRVLVTAAAGATGGAAVQVARLLGAEVVAACGSQEKLESPRALGAADAVTYEALSSLEPVDVVFDLVGGDLFQASLTLLRPLGVAIGVGFAGGWWKPVDPALLVGRNIGPAGLLSRSPDAVPARDRARRGERLVTHVAAGAAPPDRRCHVRARRGRRGAPADRRAALDRQGRAGPVKALVTGGASGIGAAIVTRLRSEGLEVDVLDLATGFDVSDPLAWDAVGPVDVACLNAGVLGGPPDPANLILDDYHRAMSVNVDGVALGVRRLARVMRAGGRIVCTASLGGLTAMPDDPVYAATKHAVVGFVRSAASSLRSRGIAINVVCPGIVDTPDAARRRPSAPRAGELPTAATGGCRRRGLDRTRVRRDRPCVGRATGPATARLPLPERPRPPPGGRAAGGRTAVARLTVRTRAGRIPPYDENDQPSPSAKLLRIRLATTMRCTSSGPS